MTEQEKATAAELEAGSEVEQKAEEGKEAPETPEGEEGGEKEDTEIEEDGIEPGKKEEPGKVNTEPGVQKKIDKEVGRRKRAEEDAAYWRGRAESAEGKGASGSGPTEQELIEQAASQAAGPKPLPEQFKTPAEFHEALTDWKLKHRDAVTQMKDQSRKVAEQLQATVSKGQEKYKERFAESLESLKDAVGQLKPYVVEAIAGSDTEADVLVYLGENPDVAKRINRLPPLQAAKEIARIEAKVGGEAPPEKKITTAPKPVQTLRGGKAPVESSALKADTQEDYFSRRKAAGAVRTA